MADKHLKRSSHSVSAGCWWYEEPKGINVVVEHRATDGTYMGTYQYLIPWRQVKAALERKERK